MPDNELDKLFKKAVDSVEHPFREGFWKVMDARLDRWDRFNSWFWKLLGGAIILLAITAGVLFFTLPDDDNGSAVSQFQEKVIGTEKIDSEKQPVSIEPGKGKIKRKTKQETEEMSGFPAAPVNPTGKATSNPVPVRKITSEQHENTGLDRVKQDSKIFDQYNTSHKIVAEIPLSSPEKGILKTGNEPFMTKEDLHETAYIKNPEKFIISREKKFNPHFWITLNLGPDLSGIGIKGIGMGTFEGLGFKAEIFPRFSISTGINHARKKYGVVGEYTNPMSASNNYGSTPASVNVACHVLDIPFNINYKIYKTDKKSISLGAGLSSWLMLTEEYSFIYGGYYGSPSIQDYTIRNQNQHYFGILNFSAGYIRYLNEKWAWKIEPYYKLPLVDIAAAKIRLNSFGVLFSIEYKLK